MTNIAFTSQVVPLLSSLGWTDGRMDGGSWRRGFSLGCRKENGDKEIDIRLFEEKQHKTESQHNFIELKNGGTKL